MIARTDVTLSALFGVSVLLAAVSIAWLFPFTYSLLYGSIWAGEPNIVILAGGLLLFVVLVNLGVCGAVFAIIQLRYLRKNGNRAESKV